MAFFLKVDLKDVKRKRGEMDLGQAEKMMIEL